MEVQGGNRNAREARHLTFPSNTNQKTYMGLHGSAALPALMRMILGRTVGHSSIDVRSARDLSHVKRGSSIAPGHPSVRALLVSTHAGRSTREYQHSIFDLINLLPSPSPPPSPLRLISRYTLRLSPISQPLQHCGLNLGEIDLKT